MRERTVEFFFEDSSIAKLSLKASHRATLKLMECQRSVDEQTGKEEPLADRRDGSFGNQTFTEEDGFCAARNQKKCEEEEEDD